MSQQRDRDVLVATCPSHTSLARIANKWTAMVVTVLGDGRLRFGEIRTAVDGISGKVLTDTLRDFERDGLVEPRGIATITVDPFLLSRAHVFTRPDSAAASAFANRRSLGDSPELTQSKLPAS